MTETKKWDKEWLRYFSSEKDYSFYFYDMDTPHYALLISKKQITNLSEAEFYNQVFFREIKGRLWAKGTDLVDKSVLEIGCGPGPFGKVASRFVKSYTGIDISQFALSIARLTSPSKCHYIHLFDMARLQQLVQSHECSIARHFFIHHNFENSLWILKLLRDMCKPGSPIFADFYHNPSAIDSTRTLSAHDNLSNKYPSALFSFTIEDVNQLSMQAGLICSETILMKSLDRIFVRFEVSQNTDD